MFDIYKFPYTEVHTPVHGYIFHLKCTWCKKPVDLMLPAQGLFYYGKGKHVQHAFPMMDQGDREMIITGTCKACQDDIFGEPESEPEPMPWKGFGTVGDVLVSAGKMTQDELDKLKDTND